MCSSDLYFYDKEQTYFLSNTFEDADFMPLGLHIQLKVQIVQLGNQTALLKLMKTVQLKRKNESPKFHPQTA